MPPGLKVVRVQVAAEAVDEERNPRERSEQFNLANSGIVR
jgi:hypothetical protein